MLKRGYYKEGEFVEGQAVVNPFVALTKHTKRQRWLHQCGRPMDLFPISHDVPADYWECKGCNVKITIQDRGQTFAEVIEQVKQQCQLKTLEYSHQNHYFEMISDRWIGEDRIAARRHQYDPQSPKKSKMKYYTN